MRLVPPPRGALFHAGRTPNPFSWRLPYPIDLTADPPITAGSRFDSPTGEYATLYCATTRYGALLEKLSPLRVVPDERLSASDDDPPKIEPVPFPTDVFQNLVMGSVWADADALFVDVDHPRTHAALEQCGGRALLQELGITRIDRGTFLSPDRALTRRAADAIYDLAREHASGLRYTSALDANAECWAIWDHARPLLSDYDVEPLDPKMPELAQVLPRLGFAPPS